MKIKIAGAFLCLTVASFFVVLKAETAPGRPRGTPQSSDSDSRSVWDSVYTEEQAERGHSLYHEQCASCHGDTLAGGEEAPPLAGGQFLANWNGLTLGDLFERIRRSMPQNDPGRLSRLQNADVLAYLLSFNKFPAGKAELAHDAELLKEIRIEATKPEPHDDK